MRRSRCTSALLLGRSSLRGNPAIELIHQAHGINLIHSSMLRTGPWSDSRPPIASKGTERIIHSPINLPPNEPLIQCHGRPNPQRAQGSRHLALRPSRITARKSQAHCSLLVYASLIVRVGLSLTSLGEYWMVNQILSRGLHNQDQECLEYTTSLMDKLERVT